MEEQPDGFDPSEPRHVFDSMQEALAWLKTTSGGVELTEAKIAELAEEAERGYDLDKLKERHRDGDR